MNGIRGTWAGRMCLTVFCLVVIGFLVLPIVIIVVTSFGKDAFGAFPPHAWTLAWYRELFASGSKWPPALELSVLVALITTVFSLLLGLTAANALVRSELPLRSAVYGLVLAPLVIPQVVIALGLFLIFDKASMIGDPVAIALGHTVLATPIAVLILVSTLKSIDERLEDAAASLGAGRLTIARRVVFPLAAPGLIAAAVFAFMTSFDEFFIAQFLSSVSTVTLPVQIFNTLQYNVDPSVTAISTLLIGLATAALVLVVVVRRLWGGSGEGILPSETVAVLPTKGGIE